MILVPANKVEKIKYFSTLLGLIFIEITRGPSCLAVTLFQFLFELSIFDHNKKNGLNTPFTLFSFLTFNYNATMLVNGSPWHRLFIY